MGISYRIFNKIQRVKNDFIFNTGIFARNRIQKTENTILLYHGVDLSGNTKFNSRHTARHDLIKHICFLKKYCHIISLEDFFQGKFIQGRPNITITFDDGYRNNFTNAFPIFEEMKVPATFFITGLNGSENPILWADFLDIASKITDHDISIQGEPFKNIKGQYFSEDSGKNLYDIIKHEKADHTYKQSMYAAFKDLYDFKCDPYYNEYWQLMSDDEILLCSKSPYIEIGSHGMLHDNLGTISLEDAIIDLQNSKDYLENLVQKEIVSLAYPDGSYSRQTLSAAKDIGFKYQVAAEGLLFPEDITDERMRDRKGVYSWDSCANQLMISL